MMTIDEVKKVLRERPELMDELPPLYATLARALLRKGKRTTRAGAKSPRPKS
jgi:hypothetical protein